LKVMDLSDTVGKVNGPVMNFALFDDTR